MRERGKFGSRDGEVATFPIPKYCKDGKILPKWRTLGDAITDLIDTEREFMAYPESRLKYLITFFSIKL